MDKVVPQDRTETVPGHVIVVPAPVEAPEREGMSGAWTTTLPMLGGVGSMLMVAGSTGAGGRGYVVGGLFLVSTVAMALTQVVRQHRQHSRRLAEVRARHRGHLAGARAQVVDAANEQRRRAVRREGLSAVRVGVADVPLTARLELSDEVVSRAVDPVTSHAVDSFLATWSTTPRVPVAVDLLTHPEFHVRGSDSACHDAVRALVVRAARIHAPDDLLIAVVARRDRLPSWEWAKWLPHTRSPAAADDVGPSRLVVSDPVALPLLLDGVTRPVLVVVDGTHPPDRSAAGRCSTIVLGGTAPVPHLLDVAGPGHRAATLRRPGVPPLDVDPDWLGPEEAEASAREVARSYASAVVPGPGNPSRVDVGELLGLTGTGPASDLPSRPVAERLDVVVGTDPAGEPVRLNLRESAHGGAGPHGLVVGATGSGKSEFVRTLVLALAAHHRPDELALVLVDFKGGATFAGLGALPHVSALVTNLADDHSLVARMQDALAGEMERRQEVLHASGHANLQEYDAARRTGADLAPLPSLFVCVDEFSELLTARPEFVDLFVAIGRLGRSLGIHLLLATQRLEEGRLRGLESHLSYRVGLRTFSAAESRAAIGVTDAHTLPSRPGAGLLRQGPDELVRFDAAYVSGAASSGDEPTVPATVTAPILPFTATPVLVAPPPAPPASDVAAPTAVGGTVLDRVVDELVDGSAVRRIWLPPLDHPTTLGDHLTTPELTTAEMVIGEVDLPRQQRREALTVDLSGATGHFAVVGGPHSGRSTVLQTLVTSLALRRTPEEAHFLLLDLDGGALAPLAPLPHVRSLAHRGEDLLLRTVQEAVDIVDRREAAFREVAATSVAEFRSRTGEPLPDVYVVVDGWGALRTEHEEEELALSRLVGRGLPFGVHLLMATTRWSDLRPTVRDLVGSRLELRLGDPLDSEVDRRAAARVPVGRPGRGVDVEGRDVLTALPRIDGRHDAASAADGLRHLVETAVARWNGPTPPRLRVLPELVPVDELGPAPTSAGVAVGLTDDGTTLAVLDEEPHLLVLGDDRSGRTETLRTFLTQLTATHTPDRAQVLVVDPRGGLRGTVGEEHLVAHLGTRSRIVSGLADLAAHLRGRLPGPEVTSEQLLDRSWWSGPDVFVVVDDHDLVTAGSWQESPTRPLAELLPQAREVGLHLVLARRTDSVRSHDPVVTALTELGSPTLLLPGRPGGGTVVGHLRSRPGPAGRGQYLARGTGVRAVQVALSTDASRDLSDAPTGTAPGPPPGQRSA